ncbi:hypothetical protein JQN72_12160 [Phycicoccus sp. CSK15P-2]|uniref:MauE/DoxX family redox-associated membrane protein n=1 Tax=Phycicoccus sp. CSK15P-2 TaxID=2807627 RepID=UPI001950252A|nr:MauE/DoxX family redox-associated membrane protein [Phycicoccus sp. CSK15P-2]MBM6404996.1 hypothetical protein [Phycicoccus sp. CSK15P-2]
MPSPLVLPLLTCAVVLALGGAAGLRDPAALGRAVDSLPVPRRLRAPWLVRSVPWVEVALGLWLLVATGAALVVVTVMVLALFSGYLVLVSRAVAGPEPAECGCFGPLGEDRVTRATVVRNAVLVLAAILGVVAAVRGVAVLPAAMQGATWGWLSATALAVAVGVLVTWRSPGAEPAGNPSDGAGTAGGTSDDEDYERATVPEVQLLTDEGDLVLLTHMASLSARLLVFVRPACGACARVAPLVPVWAAELAPVSVHAVLVGGPDELGDHPGLVGHAWFDPHGIAHRALATGTPSAVLVGTDGLLAGGPVRGSDAVVAFVEEVREHLAAPDLNDGR